jgi:hypothetical protein
VEDQPGTDQPFDWGQISRDFHNPQSAVDVLYCYVDHLLSAGMSEDAICDELVAAGLSPGQSAALISAYRRNRRPPPANTIILRSGPYDFGRVFDHLRQQDIDRRERRRRQEERRQETARLARPPDPLFAPPETYAQIVTREARRGGRPWVPLMVGFLTLLPLLVVVGIPFVRWVASWFQR